MPAYLRLILTRRDLCVVVIYRCVCGRQSIYQCVPCRLANSGINMKTVIVGGTLIDGFSPEPITDAVVVVDGDQIVAAGSKKTISIPRDAESIDADGHTVMPGVIDCHLHSTYRARDVRQTPAEHTDLQRSTVNRNPRGDDCLRCYFGP